MLLPDIRPLPSLINKTSESAGEVASHVDNDSHGVFPKTPIHVRHQPRLPLTDQEFLVSVQSNSLLGWGHDTKIRLIYLLLVADLSAGHRRNVDAILETLKGIEKEHFHLTINYFWIQMVTYFISQTKLLAGDGKEIVDFDTFYRQPICQKLRNSVLYDKYYSRRVIDDQNSSVVMNLPDLKPLP